MLHITQEVYKFIFSLILCPHFISTQQHSLLLFIAIIISLLQIYYYKSTNTEIYKADVASLVYINKHDIKSKKNWQQTEVFYMPEARHTYKFLYRDVRSFWVLPTSNRTQYVRTLNNNRRYFSRDFIGYNTKKKQTYWLQCSSPEQTYLFARRNVFPSLRFYRLLREGRPQLPPAGQIPRHHRHDLQEYEPTSPRRNHVSGRCTL